MLDSINNKDELIKLIKENPNLFTFDGKGRLVSKSHFDTSLLQKSPVDFSIQCTYKLTNRLYLPEDRIPRLPIHIWLESLNKQAEHVNKQTIRELDIKTAVLFNQCSLVFMFAGYNEEARLACEKSILFYDRVYNETKSINILIQSIQAWINLARLDRAESNYVASISKLKLLNEDMAPTNRLESIVSRALNLLSEVDSPVNQVLSLCLLLEPIKTFLASGCYHKLAEVIQVENNSAPSYYYALKQEANILASMFMGDLKRSWHLVDEAIKNGVAAYAHVFYLRKAELLYMLGKKHQADVLAHKLTNLAKSEISITDPSLSDIVFAHDLSFFLKKSSQNSLFKDISNPLLLGYEKLNDEPGMISVLSMMDLNKTNSKKLYELKKKSSYRFINSEKSSTNMISTKLKILNESLISIYNK